MKVKFDTIGSRLPTGGYVWVGISALLLLGVISTVIDLTSLSEKQTKDALQHQQRIIIDAKTGATSAADRASTTPEKPKEDFEVADASEAVPVTSEPVLASNEEPSSGVPEDDAPALATDPANATISKVERTKDSLVTAPAPEVSGITPHGVLPKRGEGKDVTPAMIYARNYVRKDDIATLHLVVMGLGFGSDVFTLANDLPPEVSFAFSPYGDSLSAGVEAARNAGHEVWIGLPVQSANYPQDDPGPLGLIATLPVPVFEARLQKTLMSVVGAVGVILPTDETLSGSPKVFAEFLHALDAYGLIGVTTHPTRNVKELTNDKKIQKILAKSDVVLDDVPNEAVIKSKLAGLMDKTQERGHMIVLMHARPQTLIIVRDWLKRLAHEGVELAPLSATILRPPKMLTPDEVEPPKKEGGHGGGEAKPAAGGH
jgi:polysaccharide deacetylase 2 family uncharacterized protein YibQ